MKILIADDDPVSRRLLESTLRRLGHDVTAVGDGRAALDALLAADGPRLAILDWMMPELDGLAVCRAVRKRQAPYVYLILLTARDRREDMVAGLGAEADDFLTKPFDLNELQARIRSGLRILDLQESLLTTQAALHHEATHDRLTGLWNRGMVLDHLGREFARAERSGSPVTVAMADIDHFKSINDTYGHTMGDSALRHVAAQIRGGLRISDVVGRYGGEEFLLVLPAESPERLRSALERVRLAVSSAPIDTPSGPLNITVSIGATTGIPIGRDPSEFIALADEALYAAKDGGRNCVRSAPALASFQEPSLITPRLSA